MIFVNPYSRVNNDIPNLSVAYAATVFDAEVVDFNTWQRPLGAVTEKKTGLLGISVRSMNAGASGEIAAAYRAAHPGAQVVSVGTGIDIQCCYPFMKWQKHLGFDAEFGDDYPYPDYRLFDSFPLFLENWQSGRWKYAVMTSLGCPFPCNYCMCARRKLKTRSVDNVIGELEKAKAEYGMKSVVILDDCFNAGRKRTLEFCEKAEHLKLNLECANGLRADLFDEEVAEALAAAGCIQVSFGVETIHEELLRNIEKGETFAQIEKAITIAKKHFRYVNGFFIIGLPGSSLELDRQSLAWARKAGINAHFSYFVPKMSELPENEVFYGWEAKPLSPAYPAAQQEAFYAETAGGRPENY